MTLLIKNKIKDTVTIVNQKEIQSQSRFIDNIKPNKGHTIYEFDTKTGKLTQAEFESSSVHYHQDPLKRYKFHKLVMKKDCLYVSALNMKNAFRKLNNHVG